MVEIFLILSDIRSTYNVGSILRTADGFGVNKIFFTGYTPYPNIIFDDRMPHEAAKINRAIHKTALGAELTINCVHYPDIKKAVNEVKKLGFVVAGLEQSHKSITLSDYRPPSKVALILGNEVNGLSMETLESCDVILEIPMHGKKESFNVSNSAAVALYAINTNYDTPSSST